MKIEYRIQNTEYNVKVRKSVYIRPLNPCCIRRYEIQTIISIILFLAFDILLSGCGQKIEKPNLGLSAMQMDAYKIINDSLNSNDPNIRVTAIEISAITKQRNYLPTIHRLLQDPYGPVRYSAAVAVGETKYELALNSINQLLRDRDINVTIAASYAMFRLGYTEYLKVLQKSINSNNSQTTKAISAFLLGKSGDRDSIQLLYKLMEAPDSSEMVSYQAAEALAMLGDEKIFETIWTMLISAYNEVKISGVRAMGALGTQEAENALLTMLSDPVVEIRLAAAEQLGKMNNKSGKGVVHEVFQKKLYLMQSRERILIHASLAIGEIGTRDLTKFLPELMKNESPFVRLAAAKAVFQSSHKF